jgi:phosphoribosyl-ATP pyrophosphohydrolase
MTFAMTELQVVRWGEARGIIQNGKPIGQMVKLFEETTELFDAINMDDPSKIMDAVGDIMVVLTMICGILDMNLAECYEGAYQEIKNRKGYLRSDGVFVKDV